MGLLKHPDGQKQLQVISNSGSLDYIVHHWPGMLHKLPFLQQMPLNYPFKEANQIHETSQLHFKTTKIHFFSVPSHEKKEEIRNTEKREKILTRWSGQDYPLNMASQSLWAPNGNAVVSKKRGSEHIQPCVKQVSPLGVCMFSICVCVFVPGHRCVFAAPRSGEGYSNKCGLSFDPAARKRIAPCTHTCLEPYCHICAMAQISLLPPQASAIGGGCCLAQASALHIVSCLAHVEPPPSTSETTSKHVLKVTPSLHLTLYSMPFYFLFKHFFLSK